MAFSSTGSVLILGLTVLMIGDHSGVTYAATSATSVVPTVLSAVEFITQNVNPDNKFENVTIVSIVNGIKTDRTNTPHIATSTSNGNKPDNIDTKPDKTTTKLDQTVSKFNRTTTRLDQNADRLHPTSTELDDTTSDTATVIHDLVRTVDIRQGESVTADIIDMTQFLEDYIILHRVTRILLVTGDGDDGLSTSVPSRGVLVRWVKQLRVMIRVLRVGTGTGPPGSHLTDGAYVITPDGAICTENCAPYLVVAMVRQEKHMDTFMKVYDVLEFRRVPWVVFGSSDILDQLKTRYLALDNNVLFSVPKNNPKGINGNYELWEVYKPSAKLSMRSQAIGSWSRNKRLHQPLAREPYSRRTDLTGLHLNVVTAAFAPFVILHNHPNGTMTISGNHADLFAILQNTLNFTSSFYHPTDGVWGSIDPATGLMNGMIGQLQRNIADIAVNAIDFTPTRNNVVDYPVSLDDFGYLLVMKRPGRDPDWKSYTAEFDSPAWLLFIGAMIVTTVVMYGVSKWSPYEPFYSLGDSAVFVIAACCNMGDPYNFKGYSSRTVVIALFLTTIIVYTHYTSFLVANFAVIKIRLPFTDMQGLYANRKDYHLGMMGDSSIKDLLKTSREPFLRNLWDNMLAPNPDDLVPDNIAGFARMMTHKYVFLTYAPTYAPTTRDMKLSSTEYFKTPMSWPVQKNSPLLPIVNFQFQSWLESGQYKRLWARMQGTNDAEMSSTRALGYAEVFTAFVLLVAGCSVAIVIAVIEMATKTKDNYTGGKRHSLTLDPYADD